MKCLYITLIILSLNVSHAAIFSNLKENIISLFRRSSNHVKSGGSHDHEKLARNIEPKLPRAAAYNVLKENVLSLLPRSHSDVDRGIEPKNNKPSLHDIQPNLHPVKTHHHKNKVDYRDQSSKHKAKLSKRARAHDDDVEDFDFAPNQLPESVNQKIIDKENFLFDPVMNQFRRKFLTRRKAKAKSYSDESSSTELKDWLAELEEEVRQRKVDLQNGSKFRGDIVNMAAARPWGVPCGDPNQHDHPWGSCTLNVECDAEVRIYRGDNFCGRTPFVCCAIVFTNYDMYQAIDVSFEESSASTDSNERKGSKEGNRRQRRREKMRRRKEREKRKKLIKGHVNLLVKEIRKVLNRAFRNGTAQRKRRKKELRKLVEDLKKKFRKDRNAFMGVHEYEIQRIDDDLQKRLDQVKDVNHGFMSNDTYRDIIMNGTVNKRLLRMLHSNPAYSHLFRELLEMPSRRSGLSNEKPGRRSGASIERRGRRSGLINEKPGWRSDVNNERHSRSSGLSRRSGYSNDRRRRQSDSSKKKKKDLNILQYDIESGNSEY